MQFAEKGFVEIFNRHGIDSMKIKTETGRPITLVKYIVKIKGVRFYFISYKLLA